MVTARAAQDPMTKNHTVDLGHPGESWHLTVIAGGTWCYGLRVIVAAQ